MRHRVLNERGVAMVTVLLVGASLTAVASVAAFTAVQEFQSGRDERRSAEAFSYAESGIDRLVLEIRRGRYTWGDIREAGCQRPAIQLPPGVVGQGLFTVELVAFDPFAATPAARFPIPPTGGACAAVTDTSPRSNPPHYFAVTSTGSHPAARRIIRFVIEVKSLNLPIGIYAESADAQGNPDMMSISMITPGDVTGRNFLGFTGTDPYYKISDFWSSGFSLDDAALQVPAGLHAVGHIFLKNENQVNNREHLPAAPMNCNANKAGSPAGQSMWDQSGDGGAISGPACAGWLGQPAGPPPTSLFTKPDLDKVTPKPALSDQDYLTLRDAAKQSGLYCLISLAGAASCTRAGVTGGSTTVGASDIATPDPLPYPNFIAYFEYENALNAQTTNLVSWETDVIGCQAPDFAPGRNVVIIIRRGSIRVEDPYVNGAIIAPEGNVTMRGSSHFNGTIIAKRFDTNGGPTMSLNQCWVNNMPGPFLDVAPYQWSEIDR